MALDGRGLLVHLAQAAPEEALLRAAHGEGQLAGAGVLAQDDELARVSRGDDVFGLGGEKRERERESERVRVSENEGEKQEVEWTQNATRAHMVAISPWLHPVSSSHVSLTLSTFTSDSSDTAQKAGVLVSPKSM